MISTKLLFITTIYMEGKYKVNENVYRQNVILRKRTKLDDYYVFYFYGDDVPYNIRRDLLTDAQDEELSWMGVGSVLDIEYTEYMYIEKNLLSNFLHVIPVHSSNFIRENFITAHSVVNITVHSKFKSCEYNTKKGDEECCIIL